MNTGKTAPLKLGRYNSDTKPFYVSVHIQATLFIKNKPYIEQICISCAIINATCNHVTLQLPRLQVGRYWHSLLYNYAAELRYFRGKWCFLGYLSHDNQYENYKVWTLSVLKSLPSTFRALKERKEILHGLYIFLWLQIHHRFWCWNLNNYFREAGMEATFLNLMSFKRLTCDCTSLFIQLLVLAQCN